MTTRNHEATVLNDENASLNSPRPQRHKRLGEAVSKEDSTTTTKRPRRRTTNAIPASFIDTTQDAFLSRGDNDDIKGSSGEQADTAAATLVSRKVDDRSRTGGDKKARGKTKQAKGVSLASSVDAMEVEVAKQVNTGSKRAPRPSRAAVGQPQDKSRAETIPQARDLGPAKQDRDDTFLFKSNEIFEQKEWWKEECVEWTDQATSEMKDVFQRDMCVGTVHGAAKAAADFAADVANSKRWIKCKNGSTKSSNGNKSFGNFLSNRSDFRSLEPVMRLVDKYHDSGPKTSPPVGWIQGNDSVKSPKVSMTHTKHRDRRNKMENYVVRNFGGENRLRAAFTWTPPTGVHEGRTKETHYAIIGGNDVLNVKNKLYSFILMGSHSSGKDEFFDTTKSEEDKKASEITAEADADDIFLDDDDEFDNYDNDSQDQDKQTDEACARHGVYHNNGAISVMLELTVSQGLVGQFVNELAHCYDDYIPENEPGSIPFRFPVAAVAFEKPNSQERRLRSIRCFEQGPFRLFQQFTEKYGHCAISKDCVDDPSEVDPAIFCSGPQCQNKLG